MKNQAIPVAEDQALAPGGRGGSLRDRLLSGLLAGVAGGVLFGLLAAPANWAVHLAASALLGLLFGWAMGDSVRSAGAGFVWGEAFGLLWWLVGPLTLLPLLRREGLIWSTEDAPVLVPQLLGAMAAFGVVLGYGYYWLARWLGSRGQGAEAGEQRTGAGDPSGPWPAPAAHAIAPRWVRALIVGGLGGLLGSWVFVWGLVGTDFYAVVAAIVRSDSVVVGRLLHYLIGLLIGCSFALLFEQEDQDAGSGLVYGMGYGLFWWIIGPLILLPWLTGSDARLYWTVEAIQRVVPSFAGHILYGALVGWFCGLASRLWQLLFVDSDPLNRMAEGAGPRGLRAILMGQAGGIAGGLLFTIVMVGIGALPRVGSLIGMQSPVAGFLVHLVISVLIGTSYGLLFYRKASSYAAEIGLGLVYGWFWWVLGAVTLFPLLLRQPVDWSLAGVTSIYPSLVGHLLYGAGLAVFYQFLARRYDDELVDGRRWGRQRSRGSDIAMARPRVLPAVWLTILIPGIVLPLLLAWGGR